MAISSLEHNQEEDTFDYFALDLSDPCRLLDTLQQLRQVVLQEGQDIFNQWRSRIHRQAFLSSGLNLAHYMALRRHDLRPLQAALIPWGLSSLGRLEARVMPNLDAVIATLGAICQVSPATFPRRPSIQAFLEGDRLLHQHTEDVFGQTLAHRRVRIMVTLPMEAASHYEFVENLLQRGTNCCTFAQSDHNTTINGLRSFNPVPENDISARQCGILTALKMLYEHLPLH